MKVSELIAWLQRLDPDYEITVDIEGDRQAITGIEPYEASREYVIWTTKETE